MTNFMPFIVSLFLTHLHTCIPFYKPTQFLYTKLKTGKAKVKIGTIWVMILDQKTLFASRNAIGMMENNDMARVMMPMVIPPVRRVTQKQHRFKQGILTKNRSGVSLETTSGICTPLVLEK